MTSSRINGPAATRRRLRRRLVRSSRIEERSPDTAGVDADTQSVQGQRSLASSLCIAGGMLQRGSHKASSRPAAMMLTPAAKTGLNADPALVTMTCPTPATSTRTLRMMKASGLGPVYKVSNQPQYFRGSRHASQP